MNRTPDKIYAWLVNNLADANSKEVFDVWCYIHDLLENEKHKILYAFVEELYKQGIDHSNDPRYYKALEKAQAIVGR